MQAPEMKSPGNRTAEDPLIAPGVSTTPLLSAWPSWLGANSQDAHAAHGPQPLPMHAHNLH